MLFIRYLYSLTGFDALISLAWYKILNFIISLQSWENDIARRMNFMANAFIRNLQLFKMRKIYRCSDCSFMLYNPLQTNVMSLGIWNVDWEYCKEEAAIVRVKWSYEFTRIVSKRRQLLVKTIWNPSCRKRLAYSVPPESDICAVSFDSKAGLTIIPNYTIWPNTESRRFCWIRL